MGRIWFLGCLAVACLCTHYSSGVAQPTLTPKQIEQNADLGLLSLFLQANNVIIVGELLDVPVKEEKAPVLAGQNLRRLELGEQPFLEHALGGLVRLIEQLAILAYKGVEALVVD